MSIKPEPKEIIWFWL